MKRSVKDLAKQRVRIIFKEAVNLVKLGNYELARKQIELALRILRKARVRKPVEYRNWICRNCKIPLIPSLTCRVRVRGTRKYIIVTKTCLLCGWVMRKPCIREKLKK